MRPNPFAALAHSRKFWLLAVDVVGSLVLYFTTKYLSPSAADDVKIVIVSLQPIFVVLIGAIVAEDNSERDNQALIAMSESNGKDADSDMPFA